MGRTYTVPRSAKGETRLLYIFTIRSFLTTAAFGVVGFLIYSLFNMFGLGIPGIIAGVAIAGIGFGVGTLTIPDSPIVGGLRKAGGEKVLDILIRTVTFKKRRKIYLYREGGNK